MINGRIAAMREFELVEVESGAKSLRSVEFEQTFHPVTGPMSEAQALHVKQQRLPERAATTGDRRFVIWDVGFGAAANAIAAVEALSQCGREICVRSFDKTTASIEFALQHSAELEYVRKHEGPLRNLLSGHKVIIADTASGTRITWTLELGNFCDQVGQETEEPPHAILYDPYSPSANPEMWTLGHFSKLRQRLDECTPCLWTNYTRSTSVRVTLLLAGFYVGEGSAIGPKEVTTVASNDPGLIEKPLDDRWLGRVERSTNGAPLRENVFTQAPITAADFERLKQHPQFA